MRTLRRKRNRLALWLTAVAVGLAGVSGCNDQARTGSGTGGQGAGSATGDQGVAPAIGGGVAGGDGSTTNRGESVANPLTSNPNGAVAGQSK